jgi:hypothetical protein
MLCLCVHTDFLFHISETKAILKTFFFSTVLKCTTYQLLLSVKFTLDNIEKARKSII